MIDARGRADLQLTIREGDFRTFGTFTASGGSYRGGLGACRAPRHEPEPLPVVEGWRFDPEGTGTRVTHGYEVTDPVTRIGWFIIGTLASFAYGVIVANGIALLLGVR